MIHGSLFSGIGGFDLAAQWMGWGNVFHCEIAEFPRKVLHHYWPNAISYENIKETDFTQWRGKVDVISGGFPCQPYSLAGKRLGKEDDRHLWPEMLRCIREIKPRWVVGENVFGIVNWNGGLVFDEVQADLEAEGYEVQAFVLPAAGVNAPHRRDRVWFVAKNTNQDGWGSEFGQKESNKRKFGNTCARNNEPVHSNDAEIGLTSDPSSDRRQRTREGFKIKEGLQPRPGTAGELEGGLEGFCSEGGVANATEQGLEGSARGSVQGGIDGFARQYNEVDGFRYWQDFPTTEPTICGGNDGLSSRLDGITFSKWRNESIKAYGNAVVPQVVFQIFKAIQKHEDDTTRLPTKGD